MMCAYLGMIVSVRMFQRTDFHEIWYKHCTIGGHPKLVILKPTIDNNNMNDARTCDVEAELASLNIGSLNDVS